MDIKYYGWIYESGYGSVVKIVDRAEAYVFNRKEKKFRRNDDWLKAMFDPGSEFEEIPKDKAMTLIEGWSKE